MKLSELKALAQKATAGRWHFHGHRPYAATEFGDIHLDGLLGNQWDEADQAILAAARNYIEELIERVERLSEALNDLTPCYCKNDLGNCANCKEKGFVLFQFGPDVPLGMK